MYECMQVCDCSLVLFETYVIIMSACFSLYVLNNNFWTDRCIFVTLCKNVSSLEIIQLLYLVIF